MSKFVLAVSFAVALLLAAPGAFATSVVINFEGMPDLASVTNQYAPQGVDFEQATILTAGVSLNEVDFPPHSGTQVVLDDGGPMAAAFLVPVSHVGGWFAYNTALTLSAYDSGNGLITTAHSLHSQLLGSNEFLFIDSVTPISRLVMSGDPAGGSFTLDDFEFTQSAAPIPEPVTLFASLLGIGSLAGYWRRRTS